MGFVICALHTPESNGEVCGLQSDKGPKVAIIGAGPAGLTAGWELISSKQEFEVIFFESDSQVGGISKTVRWRGWRFDLGGHRFFSKSSKVNELWDEMLHPEIMMFRPRKSRIYYRKKYFEYPLKAFNALRNLGFFETFLCIWSYILVRINPPKNQTTFEGWVAARFGWRLYKIFFKTYTEKVWGISTTQLQATWAAQRIKSLSLKTAILDAFGFSKKREITSLIDEFKYPTYGPGQLWESAQQKLAKEGVEFYFDELVSRVTNISPGYSIESTSKRKIEAEYVFSSIPLADVPKLLNAPFKVQEAAGNLRFRDFLVVCITVVNDKELFDDNWIYIHDPGVKVGRIQNYASWSPAMVLDGTSCLGLEYFVSEGDKLWESNDEDLINLAKKELRILGFNLNYHDVGGCVVRVKKAYPIYDSTYQTNVNMVRTWLQENHPNWFQIGRNGQHRYNNQDHSMLTASLAVQCLLNKSASVDYWNVNLDDEYHEESTQTREAPLFPTSRN
jgi:UDP-galactopyranose mutase